MKKTGNSVEELSKKYQLFDLYSKYLDAKIPRSSAHYRRGMKKINEFIVAHGDEFLINNIFKILDLEELELLRRKILAHVDFQEFNTSGNRMFSSALNRYCEFMSQGDVDLILPSIGSRLIDRPVEKCTREQIRKIKTSRGSDLIVKKSLEMSEWKCMHDSRHVTFDTDKPYLHSYMEGHHLIPLQFQDEFDVGLHVWSNVVCLCPICHRQMHYGLRTDRIRLFSSLYEVRAERLHKAGIVNTRDELVSLLFQ